MRNSPAAKTLRCVLIAASGLAAAFIAATLSAGTAYASGHDGHGGNDNGDPSFSWDTDNLRYSVGGNSYTAKSFNIPFHDYDGYLLTGWAKPCVEYRGIDGSVLRASYYDGTCPVASSPLTQWCSYPFRGGTEYFQPYVSSGAQNEVCPRRIRQSEAFYGVLYNAPAGVQLCGMLHYHGNWGSFSVSRSCAAGRRVQVSVRSHLGCQSQVADGFFQTDNAVVNDFPRLVPTGTGDNLRWGLAAGSTGNDAGCDTFAAQQDRLAAQVAAGTGYALNSDGELERFAPTEAAFTTGRTAADISYVRWTAKAASEYTVATHRGATSNENYLRRADREDASHNIVLAIHPSTETWTVPENTAASGNFGAAWHGSGTLVYDSTLRRSVLSDTRVADYPYRTRHLTETKSESLCRSEFHPRGEDSVDRIGRSTGRTLSTLRQADAQIADRYWCRSDLRYERSFKAEHHTGVTEAQRHPQARGMAAGTVFTAYGRLGCYYTTTGRTGGSGAQSCGYMFPLPQCDPDPDNGDSSDWRDYTADEIADAGTVNSAFGRAAGDACSVPVADPPSLADFDDDACVTVDLVVAENRVAASNAEPGVEAADRTLTTGTSLPPAWDLDVTSPHHRTASPPKDTGDRSGCADGSESRADHAVAAAGAARSQASAPTYASSSRTDTAPPPNDADSDINYTGATRSIAHRYASNIAEHTCSVKLAEAEAELALLVERRTAFISWLSRYQNEATANKNSFAGYTKRVSTGTGLDVLAFNDLETAKQAYADAIDPLYGALAAAIGSANTAYGNATNKTTGDVASRSDLQNASGNSGCVAHYNGEITRLKALFSGAEAAALRSIQDEEAAIEAQQNRPPSVPDPRVTVPAARPVPPVPTQRYEPAVCLDRWVDGNCVIPKDCEEDEEDEGESCDEAGRWSDEVPAMWSCPGNTHIDAGTVSGTYLGPPRADRSQPYSATYVAPERGSEAAPCPGYEVQPGATYSVFAEMYVRGRPSVTASRLPGLADVSAPVTALAVLDKLSLLGSYYPTHADRADLTAADSDDRDAAGVSLAVAVGSVTVGSPQEVTDFQSAYKTAYDNAYTRATGHMSGTAWESFDWRYETPTLAWGSYGEDPAVTGGCDLIAIDSDGAVTVTATRLNFEGSGHGPEYGVGLPLEARRGGLAKRVARERQNSTSNISLPPQQEQTVPKRPHSGM